MMKLIHSQKIEKKIQKVIKSKYFAAHEKSDAYVVDGFKMYEIFEEGFNLALKIKEENLNVYYAYHDDFILFFIAEKESDVLNRISDWKDE